MAEHDVEAYWTAVGEHIASRWDGNAAAGDASPFIACQSHAVTEQFIRQMGVAGRSVLEVGCGPGGKLADVHRLGPRRLVGADLSPKMVEIARGRFSAEEVEVVQLDGERYPFDDREFELSYTCTVLHHNPDSALPAILGEMARVTAEEIVLIESTARKPFSAGASFHLRAVETYADLLEPTGFDLVRAQPLRSYVSELVSDLAIRLAHTRRLRRPPYREGAPVPPLRRRVERLSLPLTRQLDRVVPQRRGLTCMTFVRPGTAIAAEREAAGR